MEKQQHPLTTGVEHVTSASSGREWKWVNYSHPGRGSTLLNFTEVCNGLQKVPPPRTFSSGVTLGDRIE